MPDGTTCRLHLRIDPSGDGILIVNASTILHLNSSATEFAYHLIKESPETVIVEEFGKRYKATAPQVAEDFNIFKGQARVTDLLLPILTLKVFWTLKELNFIRITYLPPFDWIAP